VTAAPDILEIDDRDRWNAFVLAHPSGHFFQSWEWGDLQDGLGGRPLRLGAVADGRLVGCVQVLVFDTGTRKFAYVPRGPVADPIDDGVVDALLEAALAVSEGIGCFMARVEPQWPSDAAIAARLAERGFASARQRIMPARTLIVDLSPPLEGIWASFRSNTRNRVRLAEKLGVEVHVATSDDVAVFARLFEETNTRHGLRLARTEAFHLASRYFGPLDTMRLFLARAAGEDLAGIMVFLWGRTATYLWGASSARDSARKLNPNQLLHWTAMQWARERGCTAYDLFGIPDHDEGVLEAEYSQRSGGWWNLYKFKRGFRGTVHRHMGTFDHVFAPAVTSQPPAPAASQSPDG
jgi:peptidoglycan pentaglycine glycine transferase (the first glycine)